MEDQGVDGRMILKWIFKKWNWGMDWIDLAKERNRGLALIDVIMNLRGP